MSEHDTQPVPVSEPPTAAELSARIEALERENATLKAQAAAAPPSTTPGTGEPRVRKHRARAFASILLILLGALLAPVSVVAHWAQRELTDTDRYVATIGPLASDPVIQSALANRLTAEVMARVDVAALVDDAVTGLSEQGLPPRLTQALTALEQPIVNGVTSFVHDAATRVVESDAFETIWVEANRVAHEQLVAVMRGDEGSILQIGEEGQLSIQLSGMIERLKSELVDAGFGVAANIPEVNASFTIVETTQLVRVQNAYQQLVLLGTWLPWVSLGLLAAGVLTSPRRTRALVIAGLALAASMLVLGIGLHFGRIFYLQALSGSVQRLDAAEVVFDQVVAFIRLSLRTVGVLGLVIALAGYFGGGSESARSMRRGIGKGFAWVRTWGERRGVSTGPVGEWLFRHRMFVRVALISVAGLIILLAGTPTPALIVTVAVVTAVLVAIVELVARPPQASDVEVRAS